MENKSNKIKKLFFSLNKILVISGSILAFFLLYDFPAARLNTFKRDENVIEVPYSVRGGSEIFFNNEEKNIQHQDEKLVKSVLSRSNESDIDCPSLNKVDKRILEMSKFIIKPFFDNPKLAQILARLEKKPVHEPLRMTPMGKHSSLFVEGLTNRRPSNSSTDLLFRNKRFHIDRTMRSDIMYVTKSKYIKEELNKIFSTNLFPDRPQVSEFTEGNQISLTLAYEEVKRRASLINPEWNCSYKRFRKLATECNIVDEKSVKEAISILEGEMRGYYCNSRRVNYGSDEIQGIDYAVDGIGRFEQISHVECKNPVGSAIDLSDGFVPNLYQQGRRVGKKAVWQKRHWSNKTRTF